MCVMEKKSVKYKRVIAGVLCTILLMQNVTPVFAADTSDEVTAEFNVENAAPVEAVTSSETEVAVKEGFFVENNKTYYYENGVRATGERYITDANGNGNWYYFIPEQNGEMDTEWAYIPAANKWCYYDMKGRRQTGERYIDGHWYLFNGETGAVTYGFAWIENLQKWVFYDRIMGWMLYGEQFIDGGWYYFDPVTGERDTEWAYIPNLNKWVYYDGNGRMLYGEQYIDGKWEYFDNVTGKVYSAQDKINKVVNTAYSAAGKNIDCPGILAANGGKTCHYGPCMSLVWWIFYESGMSGHLADGLKSGWPHENYDWYNCRGRVDKNPKVGDIAFFWYYNFAGVEGVSCSHAGIVVAVNGDSVLVIDALDSGIQPRWRSKYSVLGFAHPYY